MAVDNTALPPALLDLVAASDTGVFNTDNLTNDSTPTVTGTAEAGASIALTIGANVRTITADSTTPYPIPHTPYCLFMASPPDAAPASAIPFP